MRQVAEHEYRVMSRLANDRLLPPRDLVDDELGVGLVFPRDERLQRLDLWLADHPEGPPATTRSGAAAGRGGVGLRAPAPGRAPRADPGGRVGAFLADGGVRVVVGDWQSAGALAGGTGPLDRPAWRRG